MRCSEDTGAVGPELPCRSAAVRRSVFRLTELLRDGLTESIGENNSGQDSAMEKEFEGPCN